MTLAVRPTAFLGKRKEPETFTINSLPEELLLHIFFRIGLDNPSEWINCSLVCRKWQRLVKDETLSKKLLRAYFPHYDLKDNVPFYDQLKSLEINQAINQETIRSYRDRFTSLFHTKKTIYNQRPNGQFNPVLCKVHEWLCLAPNTADSANRIYVMNPQFHTKTTLFANNHQACLGLFYEKNCIYGLFLTQDQSVDLLMWKIDTICNNSHGFLPPDCTYLLELRSVDPKDLKHFVIQDQNLFLGTNDTVLLFTLHESELYLLEGAEEETPSNEPRGMYHDTLSLGTPTESIVCLNLHQNLLLIGKQSSQLNYPAGLLDIWELQPQIKKIGSFVTTGIKIGTIKAINKTLVLLGCDDGTIQVFDLTKKATIKKMGQPSNPMVAPDLHLASVEIDKDLDDIYATYTDHSLKVWNYQTGQCLLSYPKAHALHRSYLTSFASCLFFLSDSGINCINFQNNATNSDQLLKHFLDELQNQITWNDEELKDYFSFLPRPILQKIKKQFKVEFPDLQNEDFFASHNLPKYREQLMITIAALVRV
jgi:hypothetical protein